eukprot:3231823-Pyramimonas_sp.AAC.1
MASSATTLRAGAGAVGLRHPGLLSSSHRLVSAPRAAPGASGAVASSGAWQRVRLRPAHGRPAGRPLP